MYTVTRGAEEIVVRKLTVSGDNGANSVVVISIPVTAFIATSAGVRSVTDVGNEEILRQVLSLIPWKEGGTMRS